MPFCKHLIIILIVSLSGCSLTPPPVTTQKGSFQILTNGTTLGEGQSLQLRWSITPDASIPVSWACDKTGIVAISRTGRVTALKSGSVTITGTTSTQLKASVRLTVTSVPPSPSAIYFHNTTYKRIHIEEFDNPVEMQGVGIEKDNHYKTENGRLMLHDGSRDLNHPLMKLPLTLPESCSLIRIVFRTGNTYLPKFGIEDAAGNNRFFFFRQNASGQKPAVTAADGSPLKEIADFTDSHRQRFLILDVTAGGTNVFESLDGQPLPKTYAAIPDLSGDIEFGTNPVFLFGEQPPLSSADGSEYCEIAYIAFYKSTEKQTNIIPEPVSVKIEDTDRVFLLSKETAIRNEAGNDVEPVLQLLKDRLQKSFGLALSESGTTGSISFVTNNEIAHEEGYRITVNSSGAQIEASAYNGFLYGVCTLLKLLPPDVFGNAASITVAPTLPFVTIEDQPRYPYRGFMLDESRTFFGAQTVKRLLDQLAYLKINRFHWHLTDDGGFRFPFSGTVTCSSGNRYDLSEMMKRAAWRTKDVPATHTPDWEFLEQNDPNAYGGVYTIEELREIVTYAATRGIQIIPEFDVPGHCKPLYDLLTATDGTTGIRCDGYYSSTPRGPKQVVFNPLTGTDLCPSSEDTYEVITEMYRQMHEVFQSAYLNIGGDEARISGNHLGFGPWWYCRRCQNKLRELNWITIGYDSMHKLQSYFFDRLRENLVPLVRDNLIMWNTVSAYGYFYPSADNIVLDWNYEKNTYNSRTQAKIVNASQGKYYLTFNQSQWDKSNLNLGANSWARVNTAASMYLYDTDKNNAGTSIPEERLIGIEACYWTEKTTGFSKNGTAYTPEMHMIYMCFPRLAAIAERMWSPESKKDFYAFRDRLQSEFQRYDASEWDGVCQDERYLFPE
ncbi:MAG: family 20 glycosylhydrolase [Spirochaetia bacterium]|nr:family 20 glycosylhydrolase [Spirochaetia bacterium]